MQTSNERPDRVEIPAPYQEFEQIAIELIEGVKVLAKQLRTTPRPMMFLAGQATESLLKAYLSKSMKEKELRATGHDIQSLWSLAIGRGLMLSSVIPESLAMICELHKGPYKLRYPSQTHAFVSPNGDQLCRELDGLAAIICAPTSPSPPPPPSPVPPPPAA